MAQTATTLADVLKERWSDNELQQQFEDKAGPLKRIEAVKGHAIGKQLQVPLWKHNMGGYTSVGAGGGSLNTPNNMGVDAATYTLVYHWQPISLDASALNQASGSVDQSVISSKNAEVKSAMSEIRKNQVRQLVTNGDSIIAECTTTTAAAEIELDPNGRGYQAIRRGWLHVGSIIDVGTTADTDLRLTGGTVTALEVNASTPSITTATSVTTDASDDVYIANPNSATAPNTEMNGLRNIVNTTGAVGGLNPATAGEEFWRAAARDTSTTVFSLDLALNLQQEVLQSSGELFTDVWTGYKQQRNFYSLLQNQVRFQGELRMGAGDQDQPTWNGMKVAAYPDVLDTDFWVLTLPDFVRITGAWTKPTWASNIAGQSGLPWESLTTRFTDALVHPMQIGIRRRNTHAGATGLTA